MKLELVQPINLLELFPGLSKELELCLNSIPDSDWSNPTACTGWSVKDLVAHLIGGNVNRLKDQTALYANEPELVTLFGLANQMPQPTGLFTDFDELLSFINKSNQTWVNLTSQFSSVELINFVRKTDNLLFKHFSSLDPNFVTNTGVLWAGESTSEVWFDIAREYTEKWLHQQQIREAVQFDDLYERQWLFPVFDTFMRGLPHNFRNFDPGKDSSIAISILGSAGGHWSLLHENENWILYSGLSTNPIAHIQLDQVLAWRLFTKGISKDEVQNKIETIGDQSVVSTFLEMVTIMA